MKETIRLFKALPIETIHYKKCSDKLLKHTLERGFIFSPQIINNYSEEELYNIVKDIEQEIGLTKEEANNTFHKSWSKIRDSTDEQLLVEQLIHYFTTYGLENLGLYNEDNIYIPHEQLDIPELEKDIKLIVIRGYTKEQLKEKLLVMANSGIAFKEQSLNDIVNVAKFVELTNDEMLFVKNKEIKVMFYICLGIIPKNPVEFLRLIVYFKTNKTLLIKDRNTINAIKEKSNILSLKYFERYKKQYTFNGLASIFYRYKPLFLALKTESKLKPIINKIRKLAIKHNKPANTDYLNNLTNTIIQNKTVSMDELNSELDSVNVFRKIRLAQTLKYRMEFSDSVLYRIRNGKSWAAVPNKISDINTLKKVYDEVIKSIVKDISKNVRYKKIYIPDYINYALPATEKQFTGYFPSGTSIVVDKDIVFGVHWKNVKGHRIDLDLSIIANKKYGWDDNYRSNNGTILFSGDITDASGKGASEMFYVKQQIEDQFLVNLNYYNYNKSVLVPYKIIVGKSHENMLGQNYMIDPNKILSTVKTEISERQQIIGMVITTPSECRFYFMQTDFDNNISSRLNDHTKLARQYLCNSCMNTINFRDILKDAGAILVDDVKLADIDLSPENIEKDTFINLLM